MASAKAGSKEEAVFSLFRQKASGLELSGKCRFHTGNVEISTDESFTYNGVNYLVEVDSGNMAKVLVGQYVLINALQNNEKENFCYLVVHTFNNYNPQRTLFNLAFVNQQIFSNEGIPFGAIHLNTLKEWSGGNMEQLVALFTQAQQDAPADAQNRRG